MKIFNLISIACLFGILVLSNDLNAQINLKDTLLQPSLDARAYHIHRSGFQNSKIRFELKKKGRVAFLGGSITYNTGWRDSIQKYLVRRFPETEFEFIAAGIPSMGSTSAAFRLERDVMAQGSVDLLFEEAAVNDHAIGRSSSAQIRGMEGIIRHLKRSNPAIDILMMHFVDPNKMSIYRKGEVPEVIRNHEKVADRYAISTINLAKEVTDRIDNGEFTWAADFKNLHPSPFGQGVYARSIIHFLDQAYSLELTPKQKIQFAELPEKIDALSYDNGILVDISLVKLTKGWKIDPDWAPTDRAGTRANYVHVPMLIGTAGAQTFQMTFDGTAAGMVVAAGPDAGIMEYKIDSGAWKSINLFTRHSKNLHLPHYVLFSDDLAPERHKLTLRMTEKKDQNSIGRVVRIRTFFVNGTH